MFEAKSNISSNHWQQSGQTYAILSALDRVISKNRKVEALARFTSNTRVLETATWGPNFPLLGENPSARANTVKMTTNWKADMTIDERYGMLLDTVEVAVLSSIWNSLLKLQFSECAKSLHYDLSSTIRHLSNVCNEETEQSITTATSKNNEYQARSVNTRCNTLQFLSNFRLKRNCGMIKYVTVSCKPTPPHAEVRMPLCSPCGATKHDMYSYSFDAHANFVARF